MLGKDTFRAWTEIFAPGSYYECDWSKGSKTLFLAPEETGEMSGMVSRVKENNPNEYISVEHIGIVHDGKEDTSSKEATDWTGALENYTFKGENGKTEVLADVDTDDEFVGMFQEMWPRALQKFKEIAEK